MKPLKQPWLVDPTFHESRHPFHILLPPRRQVLAPTQGPEQPPTDRVLIRVAGLPQERSDVRRDGGFGCDWLW